MEKLKELLMVKNVQCQVKDIEILDACLALLSAGMNLVCQLCVH